MQNSFKLFGSIAKTEEQDDGTIKVYGIASSGARDGAGEVILPLAMKAALPDYSRFPALREMHEAKAAGRVLEASVDEDGFTNIVAHVVDPIAVQKVKTQVYPAFSIGGTVLERDKTDKTIITAMRLVEISLVDSPCNPDAALTMWKADMIEEFKPAPADVIARAKLLAKAEGHQRFKDRLFEACQELMSEHLLEKGIEEPAGEVIEIDGTVQAEDVAKVVPAGGDPDEDDHAGEGDLEDAIVVEEKNASSAVGEVVVTDAAPEDLKSAADVLQAALDSALEKAKEPEAIAAVVAEEASPLADFGKVASALKALKAPIIANDLFASTSVTKSLYTVGRLAALLDALASIQSSSDWEEDYEGDDSKVPSLLADSFRQLGDTLVSMAQEEVAEALAAMAGDSELVIEFVGDDDVVLYAQQVVDLTKANEELMTKAGSRNSKQDQEQIQSAHDALMKVGAVCDQGNCPDAEKLAALESDNEKLTKTLADAAPQVTELGDVITALKSEVADLRKRFDAEPLPAKTAGPAAVRLVTKAEDAAGGSSGADNSTAAADLAAELAKLSDEERGLLMIKASHLKPQVVGR